MEENLNKFVDMLEERRRTSDTMWAIRPRNIAFFHNQNLNYTPETIKRIILHSYRLKTILSIISKSQQIPENLLLKSVTQIINEVGYDKSDVTLRLLGFIVTKILKNLYSCLYLNEAKLLQIKFNMGSNPLLLVPTHRSYCDFILLSYVFFTYDIDIPRIAAGMDFHSMKFMGNVLRKSCAFFMRRSFANDELYSAVFSEYVKTLVTDGSGGVEFYIEGTRSRSGKSLMPKYGFLSMALKAFFVGLVPDVTILPISISYDRVLEEVLFAYELLGVPKPKESTRGFFKALSVLNENYSDVHIQFGEPFSVKNFYGKQLDRSVHGVGSVQLQELTIQEIKQIIHLAHSIVRKQNKLTILSCFNLIALVLNNNFLTDIHPITIDRTLVEVDWLLSVFKVITPEECTSAIPVITKDLILKHLNIHKSLVCTSDKEEIQFCRIHNRNASINASVWKGHGLKHNTMDTAIPLLLLQYYANPCSSFLIKVCLIDIIIWSIPEEYPISKDQLLIKFKLLCSVLSYEFVFHPNFIESDFLEAVSHSQTLNILRIEDKNKVIRMKNEKFHSYSKNILSSYLPGYFTVLDVLIEFQDTKLNEKEVLKNCQRIVELKLEEGTITHPGNLSLDLLSNAFHSFVSMEIVSKTKGKNETYYQVNQKEIVDLKNKLVKYDVCSRLNSNLTQHFSTFVKNNL